MPQKSRAFIEYPPPAVILIGGILALSSCRNATIAEHDMTGRRTYRTVDYMEMGNVSVGAPIGANCDGGQWSGVAGLCYNSLEECSRSYAFKPGPCIQLEKDAVGEKNEKACYKLPDDAACFNSWADCLSAAEEKRERDGKTRACRLKL